jgi:hypothetical protein
MSELPWRRRIADQTFVRIIGAILAPRNAQEEAGEPRSRGQCSLTFIKEITHALQLPLTSIISTFGQTALSGGQILRLPPSLFPLKYPRA